MNWLFRPSNLVLISVVLALGALVLWFWPVDRNIVRPVPAGDQEVAWLNPATGSGAWERFVAAVYRLQADRPDLGLEIAPNVNPFPARTTEVPELALSIRGRNGQIWFRWYKLTGDRGHRQWVEALARRTPQPLAIMGGGTSDRAQELARELSDQKDKFAKPPPLIITSASSERIPDPALTELDWPVLMDLYPSRSFRFCFTNRQMAEAVTDFIWAHDDLRPDSQPIYVTKWEDDGYSRDLFHEFRKLLLPEGQFGRQLEAARDRRHATEFIARWWAWLGTHLVQRGVVLSSPPIAPVWEAEGAHRLMSTLVRWDIPYSVGGFNQPNRWEEAAALSLVDYLEQNPAQRRPLLVVPGSPQASRRFLHAVASLSPVSDPDYIVATGDYIDFNTIYRDRNITWPIQDLPVTLVTFSQRNPVDPAAFCADDPFDTSRPNPAGRTSTGTHDLLLYRDIVETMLNAAYRPDGAIADASEFAAALADARLPNGERRFDEQGNLRSGIGEYVVCLRPVRKHGRVLPKANLQVWNRRTDGAGQRRWEPVGIDGHLDLEVAYTRGGNAEKQ